MCIVVNRPYMRYIEVFILMVTSSTSIRFPFSLSASPCVRIRDTGEPPRCPMYIYVCKSFYIFLLFILSSTKPPRRCEKWNENCIKRTHSHTTHTHTCHGHTSKRGIEVVFVGIAVSLIWCEHTYHFQRSPHTSRRVNENADCIVSFALIASHIFIVHPHLSNTTI